MTTAITKPATSGTCGVVGCNNAADLETQRRTGPNSWTVSLTCLADASLEELAAIPLPQD